jgi:hypothetical protein
MSSGPAAATPALRAGASLSEVGSVKDAPPVRLAELAEPALETGARWSILIMAASLEHRTGMGKLVPGDRMRELNS